MNRTARLLCIILAPLLAVLITYRYLQFAFFSPLDRNDSKKRLVQIDPDKTFSEICKTLQSSGVLRYCWSFDLLARMRKVDTAIQAGEYEIAPNMEPQAILTKLASGEVYKRSVMVKPGDSIWQIGAVVEEAGLLPKDEFNKSMVDRRLLAMAGISADSFEGYLFPDTYNYSRPVKPQQIIWRMLEAGEKVWSNEWSLRAEELHLSRHEVLTLASIIEKESGNVEEQPVISSVFHNRLTAGMKLQSDPTVIYGIPNFNGNLTRENLETPSPYNTYTNFGLPPGPIANPGKAAIQAALYPKQTTFLFFVGDGRGSHIFSTTLQEHNEAVKKYQIDPARKAAQASSPAAAQPQ